MATSEAESLRGRRSRWGGEWPNRLLPLPPLPCVRVGIKIPPARRGRRCPLTTSTRARRLRPHRRRRSGLQTRAHAERGTHRLVPRADEPQLRAHVDALVVRAGIRAREALDEREQCGRVVGAASAASGKKAKEKRGMRRWISDAAQEKALGRTRRERGRRDARIRAARVGRENGAPEPRCAFVEAELFPKLEALLCTESASLE